MSQYINNIYAFNEDFIILVTGNRKQKLDYNENELIGRYTI